MTTGFGFCPNCGTPRITAEQRFCAGCGSDLSTGAAPAQAAPAVGPVAPPPPPPGQPYPPSYPYAPAPGQYGAPGPTANRTPQLLAVGALVLVVLAIVALVFLNTKSNTGSITFTPASHSCTSSIEQTLTITLPASVRQADTLTLKVDGTKVVDFTVDTLRFVKQGDGTWLLSITGPTGNIGVNCGGLTTMGTHKMTIADATGRVLAEGSVTLTP